MERLNIVSLKGVAHISVVDSLSFPPPGSLEAYQSLNNGNWIFDDNEVLDVFFIVQKYRSLLSSLSYTGQGQPPCVDLREGDPTHGGILHPQHRQFLRPKLPQEGPQIHSDSGKEACAGLMVGQV